MTKDLNVSVIIPAAGLSARMKADKRKPYLVLGGKPIIFHTLDKFFQLPAIKEIILVVNKDDISSVTEKWSNKLKNYNVSKIIPGGKRRQDSVYEGLLQMNADTEIVLVHDGVRPIVSRNTIEIVIEKAYEIGAAIVATPMKSTVKKTDPELNIIETIPRHNLWMAQTPQGFRRNIILNAYDKIRNTDIEFTDDAEVVERSGHTVKIVSGSDDNIKITTREDLRLAESLLLIS
ncbi:MAG: 2-C-methyl-D-erythritol 4-phosphate cytidylyltransferase [Candidatus Scalinduaceae bacterium]